MTAGAKRWKVWGIKSGVGGVEMVVSLLGGGKERVPRGLFVAMARGDGEERGVWSGSRVVQCVGAKAGCTLRLHAQDAPS